MRILPLRSIDIALCAVITLCAATVAPIKGCDFGSRGFACAYPPATYHVRTPEDRTPGDAIPVVVILHDAGGSGADIIDNTRLIEAFHQAGFAVIAPDALPRNNRRLIYRGDRPGMVEGQGDSFINATYSKRKLLVREPGGMVRDLDYQRDRAWYYYNVDQMVYSGGSYGRPETDYIGRDEIAVLRQVLEDSASNHGTAQEASIILGFGHGGSLIWQIACHAPDLAEVFAPVGGAFWNDLPAACVPGARLLHTHERASDFWPLDGAGGGERRYERISIFDNLGLLLNANWCDIDRKAGARIGASGHLTTWDDCVDGGPIELLVLDQPFAFQAWWLAELLNRLAPPVTEDAPAAEPEAPSAAGPVFKLPGSDRGSLFKRPKARAGN